MFRKSNRHRWLASYLVTVLFLVPVPNSSFAVEENVVIAYQGPLSGPEAQVGIDELNGVRYAVSVFNEKFAGKIKVVIKELDDQGDPGVAPNVAKPAAADGTILGIVGPAYSGATIASLPYYKPANIPIISPSASRITLTDPTQAQTGYPIFHRVAMTDKSQGPSLFTVATRGVTNPKVFLIDDQSAYGVGLIQYLRQGNPSAPITGTDSVPDSTTDWAPTLAKIKAAGSNVVIYAGYYVQTARLVKQLRDAGYNGVIASGDGSMSTAITSLAPISTLDGVRLTSSTVPIGNISPQLELDFKSRIGVSSGTFTLESIDATNIFLYCIAGGARSRPAMLNCVKQFKGISISGRTLAFDANGDLLNPIWHEFWISKNSVGNTPFVLMNGTWGKIQTLDDAWQNFAWYSLINSTGTPSGGGSNLPKKPTTPTFSLINFSGNNININVNLGEAGETRPDKIFLVAPKLGFTSDNPAEGTIVGSSASWTLNLGSLLGGSLIPIEIVGQKNGIKSDVLLGSYTSPITAPALIPPTPTNFTSRISGNSAIITVSISSTESSRASEGYLFSQAMGIQKNDPLQGGIVGNKAIFELPIKTNMIGKKYNVTIFLRNNKGESKPLISILSIPGATKKISSPIPSKISTPKTVICVRNTQARTFEGTLCPPGWNKR